MSPVAHLQFGWWFAHWGKFTRAERAAIALAGAGPDLDGITFVLGADLYYRSHHIWLHNAGAIFAVLVVALAVFRRRTPVALLVPFAFAMHPVEDYLTVGWNMHPWQPFSSAAVNLSTHLPNWLVQGVFQVTGMTFILAMTVWIYIRHGRTPLEIISPRLDRLLVNYAVLPWRNVCSLCTRRANFQCEGCGKKCCSSHARVGAGLVPQCDACTAR